jgi:DNA-binding HxlR family transcriptional regulator
LIIDVLLEDGKQRFVELANKIPQVSDRVLVERLKELEREEIVFKENNLYCLTPRGIALEKSMMSVKRWAETWVREEECS